MHNHDTPLVMPDTCGMLQMTEIAEHLAEDMAEEGLQVRRRSTTSCMSRWSAYQQMPVPYHCMRLLAAAHATCHFKCLLLISGTSLAPGWVVMQPFKPVSGPTKIMCKLQGRTVTVKLKSATTFEVAAGRPTLGHDCLDNGSHIITQ